jgi:hypothetical protein
MGYDVEVDDFFGDDQLCLLFGKISVLIFALVIRERPMSYLPSHTHPSQPDPGFTFDFALSSSSAANTLFRTRLFPPTSINNPIVLDDDDENDE